MTREEEFSYIQGSLDGSVYFLLKENLMQDRFKKVENIDIYDEFIEITKSNDIHSYEKFDKYITHLDKDGKELIHEFHKNGFKSCWIDVDLYNKLKGSVEMEIWKE